MYDFRFTRNLSAASGPAAAAEQLIVGRVLTVKRIRDLSAN